MTYTDYLVHTRTVGKRVTRKVWRDDGDGGYHAYQYQASNGEWIDYQPTVQEALAFVAESLS